jgi:hypothetical protein
MPTNDDALNFLPRIQSVFYAVFDVEKGPMILYQVPEGLIGVPPPGPLNSASIPTSPTPSTPASEGDFKTADPRILSRTERRTSRTFSSQQKRPLGSDRILFNFEEISKHIIPPSALCGRLVTCTARRYRIIGFPVKLRGDYKRIYFRYNLCFVFDRSADLSCYEPIVRKMSRVLSACEVRPTPISKEALIVISSVPGGIWIPVLSKQICCRARNSRAVVRRSEFILRNPYRNRRVQLD